MLKDFRRTTIALSIGSSQRRIALRNACFCLQMAMNFPQQMNDDALRLAHGMLSLVLKPGERVAVQLGNRTEAAAIVTAYLTTGEIFVPLNPAYTAAEMDAYLRKCIALQIGSSFSYVD